MTRTDYKKELRAAARELAIRCDGAREKDFRGYNAIDTAFGKYLADLPEKEWGESAVVSAYRMLRKYKKQLSSYGIEYEDMPEPQALGFGTGLDFPGENGERPEWWGGSETSEPADEVREVEGKIGLFFGYDEDLISEIKGRARGRKFDRGRKAWVLHLNSTNAQLALELAQREGWDITGDFREALDEAAGEEEESDGEEDRLMSLSEEGGHAIVSFDYDPEVIGEIKGRTSPRTWTGEEWKVRVNPPNSFVLLEVAAEHGFDIEGDLEKKLKSEADGIWSERIARLGGGDRALLHFPKDKSLISKVKALPGRDFIPAEDGGPHWTVPVTGSTAGTLLELLGSEGFQVEEDLLRRIDSFSERARRRLRLSRETSVENPLPVEEDLSYDLYEYQRAGVKYAQEAKRLIIADQMGLGKTISALATVHSEEAYPLVVVCPATVKTNWIREAYQCLPAKEKGISLSVLDGMDPEEKGKTTIRVGDGREGSRLSVPVNDLTADIIAVNYDILGPYVEPLKEEGLGALVVDESHYVKNPDAQRSENCEALADGVDHRILLTGTPIRNRPKEYFNQLRILDRAGSDETEFGRFFTWAKRYCDAEKTRWGWDFSGASNTDELNRALRSTCLVRRRKDEVRDEMPSLREEQVDIEISNRKEYDRASSDVLAYIRDRLKSDPDYFERVRKYLGWEKANQDDPEDLIKEKIQRSREAEHLVRMAVLREIAARGKEEGILDWARGVIEGGEKLLLFAIHHRMQDLLMEGLSEQGPAHLFASDSMEEREAQIERFQRQEECRVMVASLGAAKEGVNGLQAVSSIVGFTELPWSPADLDQATARLHRMGQEADMVNAYHLVGERTVDEEIFNLIQSKRAVVDEATEGDRESDNELADLRNDIEDLRETICGEPEKDSQPSEENQGSGGREEIQNIDSRTEGPEGKKSSKGSKPQREGAPSPEKGTPSRESEERTDVSSQDGESKQFSIPF